MRLTTLLPQAALLLATTTHASTTPADEPTPVGALWAAKWDATTLSPYTQHCLTKTTHNAKIYKLSELYPDLEEQAPQLKVFLQRSAVRGFLGRHRCARRRARAHSHEDGGCAV
ncbi:hypothetical protein A1F94_012599 [Pyrenophora tritici-repentis]|nr:hypothetical protein A1F94_012599 [Pyrenophora tritici-repentis]